MNKAKRKYLQAPGICRKCLNCRDWAHGCLPKCECGLRISPGEEALWYVAIRITYFTWGVDQTWEDMQFLNLWSLSLLRGR